MKTKEEILIAIGNLERMIELYKKELAEDRSRTYIHNDIDVFRNKISSLKWVIGDE